MLLSFWQFCCLDKDLCYTPFWSASKWYTANGVMSKHDWLWSPLRLVYDFGPRVANHSLLVENIGTANSNKFPDNVCIYVLDLFYYVSNMNSQRKVWNNAVSPHQRFCVFVSPCYSIVPRVVPCCWVAEILLWRMEVIAVETDAKPLVAGLEA